MILKDLNDHTLIICPNSTKNVILNDLGNINDIISIKFMDKEEFLHKFYFQYNTETILYLMSKYSLTMENANIYLKNMYFINKDYPDNLKLHNLYLMKKELINEDLLIIDPLFIKLLENYHVIIYGYDYLTKEDQILIDDLSKITKVDVIEFNRPDIKNLTIYEFDNLIDEVRYIASSIMKLYQKGISFSSIKLIISDEYSRMITRIFSYYNIPISLKEKSSLYDTKDGKMILENIKNNISFEKIISEFSKSKYLTLVIGILNNYINYKSSPSKVYDFIVKEFKNSIIDDSSYRDEVECVPLKNTYFKEDDYVFLMGFNNDNYPTIYKDEDFFDDKIKTILNLTTSIEMNEKERKSLLNKLYSINNLTISYKLRTDYDIYYPSIFISDYDFKVIKNKTTENIRYSKKDDELYLCSMLDDYLQYGIKHNDLELFNQNINIPYLIYDNSYTQIDKDEFLKYINNKLLLSYSTVDNFYHCKFRYYLNNVLKIDEFTDTLQIKVGNLFHYILSKMRDNDFDFDTIYDQESIKYISSKKEEFYFKKLKRELKYLLDFIKKQDTITGFNEELFENKFYVNIKNNIPVTFMGIIDKILYNSKNSLLSIIDYKTGNTEIDLRYLPFGLKMQLPSYMYLVRNDEKFKNYDIVGIYLQKILNPVSVTSDDYIKDKYDSLKLNGYTLNDKSKLEIFDSSYENSEIIKSLKVKNDGNFYTYSKVIDSSEMDKVTSIVDNKVKEATNSILNCDFEINPKRIDSVLIGCDFCKYKDICYKNEKDIVDLKGYKDLSFLSGVDK